MAASRRAPKATRSSGQPLHRVNRAAALSAPDKATCFNFSVSANICPSQLQHISSQHCRRSEKISDYPFMITKECSRGTAIIFACYALAQVRADGENDKENRK
jgi:hypothetical protein